MKGVLTMVLLLCTGMLWSNPIKVTHLRTEQLVNPMGLDTGSPRLGWVITSDKKDVMQTAWHILVASSPELLESGEGDLWDSGKVASDQSQWVTYAGKPLHSNQRCYWKVKCYTTKGASDWSAMASWSTGLLDDSEWQGDWIGCDRTMPWDSEEEEPRLSARYLRWEFRLNKPVKQATAYVAGLGLYELYVNGRRIGEQVLAPAQTDFRKTVLYNSFDLTPMLSQRNAIGVTLGNGRYFAVRRPSGKFVTHFGYPKLRLNVIIEYTDGTQEVIASDTSWQLTADGPIRSNNEYDGEVYDARKELDGWTVAGYDDSRWEKAERVGAPGGKLHGTMAPTMKVVKTVTPIRIQQKGNTCLLDMGQNMVGRLRLNVRGQAGDTIRLRFAESVSKNGNLYVANLRSAKATDLYICSGKEKEGTTWAPRFVYHGFRYVEVSGYRNPTLADFRGEVVSDEMDCLGSFSCSDTVLNSIYHNAWWGILGNYKGHPVDCPQRDERQPWLGDRAMGAWGESYLFGNGPLYAKWLRDICEAQRTDGCLPDVAPAFWNVYKDNVTWPSVLVLASDMLYTQYGDKAPIQRHYDHMKRWLLHLKEKYMNEQHLITRDYYGDWCVPPESPKLIHSKDPARQTDGQLLSTAYYIKMLQTMQRFCQVLGQESERETWAALETEMKEGFNRAFLHVGANKDSIFYGNNTVTANILPLAFHIVPEDQREIIAANTARSIREVHNGHISCGVIGVQWLLRELSRQGYSDVAWQLATNTTYPSWGYMVKEGATTIWELWNGNTAAPKMNSGNHVMLLGDLLPWCYEHLAGIHSDSNRVGFKHIILKPDFNTGTLTQAAASYNTPYGLLRSQWEKTPRGIVWNITVPANTTAEVHLPNGKVKHVGSGEREVRVRESRSR